MDSGAEVTLTVDGVPITVLTQKVDHERQTEQDARQAWVALSTPPHVQDGIPIEHLRLGHRDKFYPNCSGCAGSKTRMRQHRRQEADDRDQAGV